jgi:ABC transport system ATP-binding/permease protein
VVQNTEKKGDMDLVKRKLEVLKYHIVDLGRICNLKVGNYWADKLNAKDFNQRVADSVSNFLANADYILKEENNQLRDEVAKVELSVRQNIEGKDLEKLATEYNNKSLEDFVRNQGDLKSRPYIELNGHLIQKTNPIFMRPTSIFGRAHFFAPYKQLGNLQIDTLIFNVASLWLMILFFAVALYFNLLKKFINWLESLKLPFWRKFGRQSL